MALENTWVTFKYFLIFENDSEKENRLCMISLKKTKKQASAALALLLRPELMGAAHSNTGGCAAHPTRAAAATPGTRPLTARARPPDTPPPLPSRVAAWRAPPLGEVSCEPRLR